MGSPVPFHRADAATDQVLDALSPPHGSEGVLSTTLSFDLPTPAPALPSTTAAASMASSMPSTTPNLPRGDSTTGSSSHKNHKHRHHPPRKHHRHHHTPPSNPKAAPAASRPAPVVHAPAPVAASPASDFATSALSAHNDLRARHGAKAIVYSDKLAQIAQGWANRCEFKHSGGSLGPYGENLAVNSGTDSTVAQGIALWSAEAGDYDPQNPVASHFTQMVWKGTTEVGCAIAACHIVTPGYNFAGLSHFLVCEYSLAGNIYPAQDYFPQNVQA